MTTQDAATRPTALHRLKPLAILLVTAVIAYAAVAAWSGAAQTLAAIATIGGAAFVAGTLAATSTYAVRLARWQLILRYFGHRVPLGYSARVYLAGLALSPTPGKLGETLRSVLLLPRGVPMPDSLAAFFADRLSDVVGVALLGAVAGALAGARQPALEVLAVLVFGAAAVAAALLRSRRGVGVVTRWRAAGARPWQLALVAPALAWSRLWSLPRAALFALAGLLAFGVQGLVFGAYVQALAPQIAMLSCVAIYCSSMLVGAASMIPGGLGAVEAALAWQLSALGMDWPLALAAVVATRASTLWVGTLIGALMLGTLAGSMQQPSPGQRPAR